LALTQTNPSRRNPSDGTTDGREGRTGKAENEHGPHERAPIRTRSTTYALHPPPTPPVTGDRNFAVTTSRNSYLSILSLSACEWVYYRSGGKGIRTPNLRHAKSGDSIPEVSRAHTMPTNKHILPITVLLVFQDIYLGRCTECVPGRTRTCDLLFVVSPTQGHGPRGRDTERDGARYKDS
jgi:hypothetical protein